MPDIVVLEKRVSLLGLEVTSGNGSHQRSQSVYQLLSVISSARQLGTPQPQQEPVDWRARRQEILKNTLQEAIENDPAGAKKFLEKQLRDARDTQGRPRGPQQKNTAVPRAGEFNVSKPRNASPYSSDGQGKKERLRGKQSEPLTEPDDLLQKQ